MLFPRVTFRSINVLLIYVYILFTFLFPVLFVNKAIFGILIFNTILIFPSYKKNKHNILINPFLIQILFLYGFIISLFSDCNLEASKQFVLAPLNLFLIYLIVYYQIDLSVIIRRIGMILSLCVISIFVIYLYNDTLYLIINTFLKMYSGAASGASERDYLSSDSGGTIVFFALAGSYHLFLPLLLYFKSFLISRRRATLFCFCLVFLAVLVAGARGQLIVALICLYLWYYASITIWKRRFSIIVLVIIVSFLLYYLVSYTMFFSLDEVSNGTKISKIASFFQNLDFLKFLLGSGLASYYYVTVFGCNVYHTELSLLDMARYVGFIQTLIYIYVLICPIRLRGNNVVKLKVESLVIIGALLFYSFTNPVLINSLGHIIILWYWSKQFYLNENKCMYCNV